MVAEFVRVAVEGGASWARRSGRGELILWTDAPWLGGEASERSLAADGARLLAPVEPSKIVCVGRNYRLHAEEMGNEVPAEPLLFLKPPSSLLAPGAAIELPTASRRVEHEGELGVVLGRRLRRAEPADCLAAVFGLTCVNDVTARDLQRRDIQFTRGKGFDTFCPVGPAVVEADPTAERRIEVRVGDQLRQSGVTGAMEVGVAELLAYISGIMTLEPGDLVATGTPAGVGPLLDGDRVEVAIEGVGRLVNPVIAGR
jgi:2-keto-4-pentenoate hydratase/2-oxohepta-3-ene-1,7-dioic acid hydratase in catechol pathway